MHYYEIEGGHRLQGELAVQGSKNAVLPMMAAALLTQQVVTLYGCPQIEDVQVMCSLLTHLGAQVYRQGNMIRIQARRLSTSALPKDLVHRMRSSMMLMGPLLARTGEADLFFPGGCVIGARPIDLHLEGLRRLGYNIQEEADGHIRGWQMGEEKEAPSRQIHLHFPSVGATENILMGAALQKEETIITGAATEPEVQELCKMLVRMGVHMQGIGSERLVIRGSAQLRGVACTVPPDRIVTGTYLLAAAATGGCIRLQGVREEDQTALTAVLGEMGCQLSWQKQGGGHGYSRLSEPEQSVELEAPKVLRPVQVKTAPYPGFPTDLQAIAMACMTQAEGMSQLQETIFENRFRHVEALRRMGARIQVQGKTASIYGRNQLQAAELWATDLRAGAAMVLAALCASGSSQVHDLEYVERGYEDITRDFCALGARMQRI